MRKRLLFISLLFLGHGIIAQTVSQDDLKSRYKPGFMWNFTGMRPAKSGKSQKYDRLVFDVTYNDWYGDLKTFKNRWSSIGLNSNVLFDIPLNSSNTISIGTGFRHSLFRTENLSNLFASDSSNTFTVVKDNMTTVDVSRRLLCGNAVGIPLELRVRTKGWQHVKFHIGGTIAYQMNVYSKTVLSSPEGRKVIKNYDFVDLNRFSLSTHLRVGIRNLGLYAAYGWNPMFSNRASANLHLIQFGASLSLF